METTYQPKALSPEQLQALSQEVKQALTGLYGDRLAQVILYGSYARGDFRAESDVDYLVVLNDLEVNSANEIKCMIDSIYDLSEKYNTLISVKPTSSKKYLQSALFLYQDVRREGKVI
ncbi:nucleotidyltransferase domain-containing protein [Spirosoma linguale]|uniref:DNA polymerase beta domain protein region n=1 Tax=Spirosoma linguale (strain ATCC 33905 / DSM 74 / LMG 10896 / Claus 1) TaxID=504472 RepID=D2QBB0_SPILD|nr:DNA polymerase beta domain protein region [Spirosoma linguale DSM 74]